jgi:hypothetical protein
VNKALSIVAASQTVLLCISSTMRLGDVVFVNRIRPSALQASFTLQIS